MKSLYKDLISHKEAQLLISLTGLYESTLADILFVATVDGVNNTATTLCLLEQGKVSDNITYQLSGSPCEEVTKDGVCLFSEDVSRAYPADKMLTELSLNSYVGEPIRSSENDEVIGILVALFRRDLDNPDIVKTLFSAFSARVASDIHYEELNIRYRNTLEELAHKHQLLTEIEVISKTGGWEYRLADGNIIWTDETFRIHGLDPDDAPPIEGALSFYCEESRDILKSAFIAACEEGVPYNLELKIKDASGCIKWIQTSSNIRRNSTNQITHVYGAIEDITEQKQLRERQKEHASFIESTLNCLGDAVVVIDARGNILLSNSVTESLLEYSEKELLGKNVGILMPSQFAAMHDKYMSNYQETGEAKIIGIGRELTARKKSGDIIPIELSITESNQNGIPVYIGVIRDISERKQAQEAINHLAFYDSITTLPNIHSFERDCRSLITKGKLVKGQLYATIIDVNRFSEINLAYGLRSGDTVLKEIASRINQQISSDFKLYRAQADGFILVYSLPIFRDDEALTTNILRQELAIKAAVSNTLMVQNNEHTFFVSIGSLIVDSDSATYENIISLLEYSRKEVKTKGNNARILLTEIDYQLFERQRKIRLSIPESIKNEDFYVVLQPKFDIHKNLIASELLLRWDHPDMGAISPGEFIAVAEQTNDIVELSRWVFAQACRLISSAKSQNQHTKIAVNISGKDLIRPDFSATLLKTTEKFQVKPSSFILEITETILISDIKLVASKLEALTNLGFQFSIDDFGTGYSSLAYLRSLKIHELKIDILFVREISKNNDSAIVDSIIQMAKSLDLITVAEGVETTTQLDYLHSKGCDLFQGYLLSKPLSEEDWFDLLHLQHRETDSVENR